MLTPNEVKAIKEWAGSSHEKRMQGILRDVLALVQTVEELRGLVRRMLPAIEILATGKGIEFDQLQMIQLAGKGRAALGE